MIQVHVTNRIIDPALKSHWFFFYPLNLSNGFVAPAFIFCAGAGLYIALSRKGLRYLEFGKEFWVYLRRLAYILVWAYMLHVPAYSLSKVMAMSAAERFTWLQNDVLQTIVYGSLIALGIFFVVRNVQRAVPIWGVAALLVFTCTAFVWRWLAVAELPELITLPLRYQPPTNFPLLPWIGYLFAGAFVGGWFFSSPNKERLARWFVGVGLVAPLVIFPLKWLTTWSPWAKHWWLNSPGVHAFRVGGVLAAFGVLYLIEDKLKESRIGKLLQVAGQESLFMYISHLLVVYGKLGPKLIEALGIGNANYLTILVVWVCLTVPLLGVMWVWHWYKTAYPRLAQWTLAAQLVLLFGVFAGGWLDK
jgi:hypothetical protein